MYVLVAIRTATMSVPGSITAERFEFYAVTNLIFKNHSL